MEMFQLNEDRLKEVKSFLLFHSKVLLAQKTRVAMEGENEPQYLVSKNMDYELQKLLDFLTMHPDLPKAFSPEIESFRSLKLNLESGVALRDLKAASEFFGQIQTIKDKLKQRELCANQ